MSTGLEEVLRAFFDEQAGCLAVRADEPYAYLRSELLLDELTDGSVIGQVTFGDLPPECGAIMGVRRRSIAKGHRPPSGRLQSQQ